MKLCALILLCASMAGTPAAAGPFSTTVEYGATLAAGDGAGAISHGRSARLDLRIPRPDHVNWILQVGRQSYDQNWYPDASVALQFFNGGQLYFPIWVPAGDVTVDQAELGLRRQWATGRFRPFVEGLAGVSLTRHPNPLPNYRNDRRADPALEQVYFANTGGLAPSLSLGTGLEARGPWGIGLVASASVALTPALDLAGALFPLRLGLAWPRAPDLEAGRETGNWPASLHLSAGWSGLRDPARLRGAVGRGANAAAEIELAPREGLAVSVLGEHAAQEVVESAYRQQIDDFGNLVNVFANEKKVSMSLTAVTVGLRASRGLGPVSASLRGGLGWGHTGGYGRTVSDAYARNVAWVATASEMQVGAGNAAGGLAYAASARVRARAFAGVDAFVEAGVTGLRLEVGDVLVVPVRAGVVVR